MAYSDGYKVSGFYPSAMDADKIKHNAFHDQRMLVVSLDDDRIAWPERQILLQIGEKLFGKRKD